MQDIVCRETKWLAQILVRLIRFSITVNVPWLKISKSNKSMTKGKNNIVLAYVYLYTCNNLNTS